MRANIIPSQWRTALALVFLLFAAATVFWPATRGPFVFDDFPNLRNLSQLEGTPDVPHLRRYLFAFQGNPGRPLAALSFVIEDAAWPTDPAPYKRNNILWHLFAGVLLFALARTLARLRPKTAERRDLIALVAMAMWLLHPLQLSATMLIVQRMNILATIGMVAGLLGYLRVLAQSSWPPLTRVLGAGGVLAVSAAISILCKENGVLVFAYALALNLTLLRPSLATLPKAYRRLLALGCTGPLLVLVAAGITRWDALLYDYRFRDFSLGERLLTQSRVVIDYVQAILLPRISQQGIFHDNYSISHGLWDPPATIFAITVVTVLVVSAWRLRARVPLFSFAVLWFIAGHLLESTIWPLELYFEHRNYLPMFGPLFAIAAAACTVPRSYRRVAAVLLGSWLLLVTALTYLNARTWGDRDALAHVWLRENPESVRTIQMVASVQADSGNLAAARRTLAEGLQRVPSATELQFQIALVDCLTNGFTRPQWDALLRTARNTRNTRLVPETVAWFGNEAHTGKCHGTMSDTDFMQLAQAVMQNPAIAWQDEAIGYLYYELSRQALYHHDLDQLMSDLDASNRRRPNPLVSREQAIYLLTAGLPDPAMEYLRKSERTPQPWIKSKLLDIRTMNAPLWKSAQRMQATSH